ncbi:DNA replication/repair protein RecF [Spongisporangium articulatum]|uniref:DNA replication and repair protein RecF n=1 Tax=Spongisporangium articulatum TaxID=3362603 RepID=A0ABW8AK66_9ACTN
MRVSHLQLADFRSYTAADLQFDPGVTALVGPNGQGKTNLVEAIGYIATHGSHRVSTDAALVRQGASRAVIRCAIERDDRHALVELELVPGGSNRARVNRSPLPRAREALGLLRTVLFAPEDLALVKGDPDGRRRFLDDLLVARAPRFAGVRSDYDRALRQRNALLKSAGATIKAGRGDVRTLDVWDAHLARTGADLLAARLKLVQDLAVPTGKAYAQVSNGQGDAELTYRSSLDEAESGPDGAREAGGAPTPATGADVVPARDLLEARLLEALAKVRGKELERGVSLIGPHRDDLLLTLGGLPAKGYASHGESWSFALALRLASYELLTHDGDSEPVLILDDVFAELDAGRRARLADLVAGAEQVIVTAAVAEDVPEVLDGARVDVMASEVRRVR